MVLSPKERKRRELQRLADEIGSGCTAKAIEHVSLDDLIPYDRNARTHSEKQIYTLEGAVSLTATRLRLAQLCPGAAQFTP